MNAINESMCIVTIYTQKQERSVRLSRNREIEFPALPRALNRRPLRKEAREVDFDLNINSHPLDCFSYRKPRGCFCVAHGVSLPDKATYRTAAVISDGDGQRPKGSSSIPSEIRGNKREREGGRREKYC